MLVVFQEIEERSDRCIEQDQTGPSLKGRLKATHFQTRHERSHRLNYLHILNKVWRWIDFMNSTDDELIWLRMEDITSKRIALIQNHLSNNDHVSNSWTYSNHFSTNVLMKTYHNNVDELFRGIYENPTAGEASLGISWLYISSGLRTALNLYLLDWSSSYSISRVFEVRNI